MKASFGAGILRSLLLWNEFVADGLTVADPDVIE